MGEARGEGRAIIERVQRLALSHLKLLLEGVDLIPVLEDFLFFLGEIGSLRDYSKLSVSTFESFDVGNLD